MHTTMGCLAARPGGDMEIEIKLYGNLGHYLSDGVNRFAFRKSVGEQTTVQEMMRELGVPEQIPIVVIVNGRRVERDYVFKDGDAVNVFRPTGGG